MAQQTKATEGLSSWQELAGERNVRVIMCNTPDNYYLLGLKLNL